MKETIDFDFSYEYDLLESGITVPIKLIYSGRVEELQAKIDTGSSFCVFRRLHGESLGIEIENGSPIMIGTVTGSFKAFGHEVTINAIGVEFVSTVFFAESELFDRNVLGRSGWLNRVKLGLIEPEGKMFLSQYRD